MGDPRLRTTILGRLRTFKLSTQLISQKARSKLSAQLAKLSAQLAKLSAQLGGSGGLTAPLLARSWREAQRPIGGARDTAPGPH